MAGGSLCDGISAGVWVRQLVEHEKVCVNLVLDGCYSGRALRGDSTSRTSDHEMVDESMLESDETADTAAADEDANLGGDNTGAGVKSDSGQRNCAAKRSWLSSPVGCTVLTTCQLDQKAGEHTFEGQGGRNGILTHWILDIVSRQSSTQPPTFARVLRHAKSRLKTAMVRKPDQTPVLYGDSFYEFCGFQ